MFKAKQLIVAGLLFLSLGSGVAIFSSQACAGQEEDYKNLEILTDVLSLVRSGYVEDIDMAILIYGAIRGILGTLDPHSSFLTPEMYAEMEADTHGEYSGLGIEITVRDGSLIVVSPLEGTPAHVAGIKSGDQIVLINDKSTHDMEIIEASRLLRGSKGEEISLGIRRSGSAALLDFSIVRDLIQIQSVRSSFLYDRFGYVRIAQFQDRTSSDLRKHLAALRSENGKQLQGVILDLRNNPGGLLEQAVAVVDLFLNAGLIVYTEGREPETQLTFSAQQAGTEPQYPLVVLINGGSASAAEIVAGALQDHHRAVILGEQSFGKGSIQTVIPLGDNSGLRLTTARYFTPLGRSIQVLGISPDIVVSQQIIPLQVAAELPLREVDLKNHFTISEEAPAESNTGDSEGLTQEQQMDNQLLRAIDLLKGIYILEQSQLLSPSS